LARRKISLLGALLGALLGCATKAPPRVAAPTRAPPSGGVARLAVLPSDSLLFSDIAVALDQQLARARVSGVGPMVRANVSMEVAQLSLECVSATDECYTQVGKFLQVDRLLWGQIARDSQTTGVKVTIVLLDVGRGAQLGRAEESFPKNDVAIGGLRRLVDQATATPSKSPGSTASPTASGALSQREHAP
jgi:hypothetical protein